MEDRGLRFAIRANTMMLMIVKIGPARDVILRSPATKNLLVFSFTHKSRSFAALRMTRLEDGFVGADFTMAA
jgi:hypothetical protein